MPRQGRPASRASPAAAQPALVLLVAAVAACGCSPSPRHFDEQTRSIADSLSVGDYRKAEHLAAEACEHVARQRGAESVELARVQDLLVAALVKNGKGGTREALTSAEHALRVKEAVLGAGHPESASTLHNLGMVRLHRGELNQALALHQRGLEIRRKAPGDEASVADSLDQVGLALIRLKRFDEAGRHFAEALAVREARGQESPLELARTLAFVGLMHRMLGRFADAGPPVDRSLSLWRRYGPAHPDMTLPLQVLGDLRFLGGDTRGARQTWTEARDAAERGLGPDHVALAELLNRLGMAEASIGNLPQGRALREQALRIGERWLAPCHPQSAILVNDLADSFQAEGAYAEARRLYRKASATLDECARNAGVSPEPVTRATTAFNEAYLATKVGDWTDADRLFRTSVEIWTQALGADHPFVARGLDGLADAASAQGQFDTARRLYEQVLDMRRRSLGPTHPQVAWTLASMAVVASKAGEPGTALRLANEAVAIFDTAGAGDEPDRFAQALELRGVLQAGAGRPDEGRASLEKALSERARIFGRTHPLVASTRVALAEVDLAGGAPDAALSAALDAEATGRAHLLFTARYLPERVALAYAARRPRGLDLALSAALAGPRRGAQVLDALIRSRGVVVDELAARAHAVRRTGVQTSTAYARAMEARQRFANLLVRSLEEPVARALVDEARQAKEEAERALAEESAAERAELARSSLGLDEVRRALPAGAVLVSIVQFTRSARRLSSGTGWSKMPSFAAAILRTDRESVAMVPLGTVDDIERLVSAFRVEAGGARLHSGRDVETATREYRRAGHALRQTIWDPIAVHLQGASRIFVVPDGAIGLVPLAALPVGGSSTLLEQSPPLYYLSAERDLVATTIPTRTSARGMLALGGPAFDDAIPAIAGSPSSATGPATSDAAAPGSRSASGCASLQTLRFQPLDGTLAEVQELSGLWDARRRTEPARVLMGREASETAFKQSAHEYRVLHVATHGFFLSDACTESASTGTRGVGTLSGTRPGPGANPLLLSGLALAGANRRTAATPDGDDGILTAEEVAALDLSGVEWAVLSACDTGVGEVKAGEGVFGLRRAFQTAGARSVIMSLWSVDDQATRAWMRALYEARFDRNRATADAVHDASLTVLRDRRSKSLSTHPYFWAAFVAAGDWR